jgi:hypothetical protein
MSLRSIFSKQYRRIKETLAFYRSETTLSDHVLRGRGLPVARLFIVQLGLPNDLLGAAR